MNDRKLSHKEYLKAITKNDEANLNNLLSSSMDAYQFTNDEIIQLMSAAVKNDNIKVVEWIFNSKSLSNVDKFSIFRQLRYAENIAISKIILDYVVKHDYLKDIDNKMISDLDSMPGKGELINTMLKSSHRIGVSGSIQLDDAKTLKLEGNDQRFSTQYLDESVRRYADVNKSFHNIHDATYFSHITMSCIDNKECLSNLYKDRVDSGKLIICGAGWKDHAIGLAIQYNKATGKTYISITNRGDGALDACIANSEAKNTLMKHGQIVPGTILYELDGNLSNEFYADLQIGTNNSKMTMLNFSECIVKHLSTAKTLAVLPAGAQSHGTCSYVNPKRAIEGAMLISEILQGRELNDALISEIYNQYKIFSLQDKSSACDQLLSQYKQAKETGNNFASSSLEKLMISIIVAHQSDKHGGVELQSSRRLYDNLPEKAKIQIRPFLSEQFLQSTSSTLVAAKTSFTRPENISQKGDHDVSVYIDPHTSLEIAPYINKLHNILKENNIKSKDLKIICEGGTVLLQFSSLENWPRIKELLVTELGAKLERGQTGIYIKNIQDLKFPIAKNPEAPTDYTDAIPHKISLSKIKKMMADNQFTPATLQSLLDAGMDANHRFRDGSTILHLLVANNLKDSVNLLLSHGANPNIRDTENNLTSLDIAIMKNDTGMVRYLVNAQHNENGVTALHLAVKAENYDRVKLLLESGANQNAKLKTGDTPLHIAVGMGNEEMAKLFIAGKADINSPMPNGVTPLAIAALAGNTSMVKLLIDHGAVLKDPIILAYSQLHDIAGNDKKCREYFSEFSRRHNKNAHVVTIDPVQFAKICGSKADVVSKLIEMRVAERVQPANKENQEPDLMNVRSQDAPKFIR